MIFQKFKSSIALKLNIPIILLGLVLFTFLYAAYSYEVRSIHQYQLKQVADTISDNIAISAATNLKRVTNLLAAKNYALRIITIEEENQKIIADNNIENVGKIIQQSLTDSERVIYQTLNSKDQLTFSQFFENKFYYLNKIQLISSDDNSLRSYYT